MTYKGSEMVANMVWRDIPKTLGGCGEGDGGTSSVFSGPPARKEVIAETCCELVSYSRGSPRKRLPEVVGRQGE